MDKNEIRAGVDAVMDMMLANTNTTIGKAYVKAKEYKTISQIKQYLFVMNKAYTLKNMRDEMSDGIMVSLNKIIDDKDVSDNTKFAFKSLKDMILESKLYDEPTTPVDYVESLASGLAIIKVINDSAEKVISNEEIEQ